MIGWASLQTTGIVGYELSWAFFASVEVSLVCGIFLYHKMVGEVGRFKQRGGRSYGSWKE